MCSPKVAQIVRENLKREGKTDLSRRNFLRMGGITAAGLAVVGTPKLARPSLQEFSYGEIVDLTHVLKLDTPMFPGSLAPAREVAVTIAENGYYGNNWTLWEHTGTHCDIPAHFIEGAETADQYDVNNFVGPAAVIDISARAAEEPDTGLLVEDIEAWESEHGELPAGAIVLVNSGWDVRYNTPEDYINADADGVMRFPGISGDAARFLVEERDIKGVGVDTLSLDPGSATVFEAHTTLLGAGKFGIENVANLGAIPASGALVVVGAPRLEQGSGGWSRVLAFTPGM